MMYHVTSLFVTKRRKIETKCQKKEKKQKQNEKKQRRNLKHIFNKVTKKTNNNNDGTYTNVSLIKPSVAIRKAWRFISLIFDDVKNKDLSDWLTMKRTDEHPRKTESDGNI